VELPFLAFNGNRIVSLTQALAFSKVPGHLLVVGAVGLEISCQVKSSQDYRVACALADR
jgi:pyruvate/2-oxoglutarate dehydrogenase complex dihydrolipoamide dehydrogenase (E3) component